MYQGFSRLSCIRVEGTVLKSLHSRRAPLICVSYFPTNNKKTKENILLQKFQGPGQRFDLRPLFKQRGVGGLVDLLDVEDILAPSCGQFRQFADYFWQNTDKYFPNLRYVLK